MKLNVSKEWCLAAAEREGDAEIGACSSGLADRARALARRKGHKDADHLVVCADGSKIPVWQFYIGEAQAEQLQGL